MKGILTLIFISTFLVGKSQEDFSYKAQIDLGAGATIFSIPNSLDRAVGGAFATAIKLDATFEVKKHFSIGLGLTQNLYKTEKDTFDTFVEAKSPVILFLANYHLVDKKKINFCIGTGIGVGALNYKRTVLYDSVKTVGKIHTQGPSFLVNAQLRYYFSKSIGIYFRTQYVVNGGRLTSFKINGVEQERIENILIENVIFSFRGVSASLGISFRF